MFYQANITHYDEENGEEYIDKLLICGDTFQSVVKKITDYYGEDQLGVLDIAILGPDDFLVFDEEDTPLYNRVVEQMAKKVIW